MRKLRIMSVAIFASIFLGFPLLVTNFFPLGPKTAIEVGFQACNIIALFFNRRGRLKSSTYTYLLGFTAVEGSKLWLIPTSNNIVFVWQCFIILLPIIIAGLLLPFWSPFIFATISSSIVTLFFLSNAHSGSIMQFLSPDNQMNFLVNANVLMYGLSVVGAVYSYNVTKAVEQADRAAEIEQAHKELEEAHQELAQAYTKLEELATTDPITGLLNHRALNDRLLSEVEQVQSPGRSFGIIFADLDRFKHVNDTWGHKAGDLVLSHLASRLRESVRPTDVVARYGGEEFVILLPRRDQTQTEEIAEKLRRVVETSPVTLPGGEVIQITVSLGVATFPLHSNRIDGVMLAADNAMYQAKRTGRNKVCIAEIPEQHHEDVVTHEIEEEALAEIKRYEELFLGGTAS